MEKQGPYTVQRAFFERAYRERTAGWPRTGTSRIVEIAREYGYLRPGGRFLEIGCGEGRNLHLPLKEGCRTVGLDYVKEPLDGLRPLRESGGLMSVQGDLFCLPFRPGSFDVVMDWGVLHHLRAAEREFYPRWIGEVLAPSGVLLLGAFSEFFQHYPGESRRRQWVSHRGHYDIFFTREAFSRVMGPGWRLLHESEEVAGGDIHHYRLGIFGRMEPSEKGF